MSTVTETRPAVKTPRPKPERFVRLLIPACDVNPYALVLITVSSKADEYLVSRIPSDWGDGYRVKKLIDANDLDESLSAEVYHVHLSNEGHTCDCPGNTYRGKCKHVDAIVALRRAGKMPGGAA